MSLFRPTSQPPGTPPTSGAAETLDGELLGFVHLTADGAFAVARIRPKDGAEVVAVGPLGHVTPGQSVHLGGRWTDHPRFGHRFEAKRVLVDNPQTLSGLVKYLSSGAVSGLGPAFAERVVNHFGLDTLRVIDEQPERLREVSGIGEKRLKEIVDAWGRDRANREIHATLRGLGIGQALANRIVDRYGSSTLKVIRQEPYRLAREIKGIGFRTADTIALETGIDPADPSRAEAAAEYLLATAEGEGHCYLPLGLLIERGESLQLPAEALVGAVERLVNAGELVRHSASEPGYSPIYRLVMDQAEAFVCERLLELAQLQGGVRRAPDFAADERALGIELNIDQRKAVEHSLIAGLSVITGGPGTGKTTIVRVLLKAARSQGENWLLAAPTGRAARRLAEATGAEARTLHRLLEFNPGEACFQRDRNNPLEADGVLVDESSMVDLILMAALVDALPPGCRLVLVGDADQLPSVGPGRVLGELVAAEVVPVCVLREVYRQAADSGIVRNAWRVHAGNMPLSGHTDKEASYDDFFVVLRDEPNSTHETLLKVVGERLPRLGFDPLNDIQVLTPVHAGPLGTEALNRLLQLSLNPNGEEFVRGQRRFRMGDRVMQVRNDYDNDIFNGDTGRIELIVDGVIHVDFDGRKVSLTGEQLDDLVLAYAISIHKSQGSEYPAVIVVLSKGNRMMLKRNLLYTAITRARRFCCVMGDEWAIRTAARTEGGVERFTRLGERLRLAVGGAPDTF